VAEGTRLLSEYGGKPLSRVRIPPSPLSCEIRAPTPPEVADLPALEARADRVLAAVGIDLDAPPGTVDEFRAARCLLVAGRPPVGFARIDEHAGQAHLEQISVDPPHARQGVGARLLEAACAWAAEAGYGSITLMTFRDVPFNAPFYARHGFLEVSAPAHLAEVVAEDRRLGLHRLGARIVMRRTLRGVCPPPGLERLPTMTSTAYLGDKEVRRVGFGAMQLAGPGVFGPPRDPEAARAVLRRAIELGVDHIDTAQFYGPDVVNQLIHDTLHPYPDALRLVSKVGAVRDEKGGWNPAQRPEQLRAGVEDNLRSLEVERLDLVNLRRLPAEHGGGGVALAEQLGEMEALRQQGTIDLIGISNVSADETRQALGLADVAAVQNAYSILDRSGRDVLDLCVEHGLTYVPYFPLGSAFTGGPRKLASDPAIAEVAGRHTATPSQIALAWLLAQSERIALIPGTGSVAHLEENLAAGEIELSDEDLRRLDEVAPVANPDR
jgi:pyridoxine 4-dehydrogenase